MSVSEGSFIHDLLHPSAAARRRKEQDRKWQALKERQELPTPGDPWTVDIRTEDGRRPFLDDMSGDPAEYRSAPAKTSVVSLICERCGALVHPSPPAVALHNEWHDGGRNE